VENKDYSRRKFLNKFFGIISAFLGSFLFLISCNTNQSSLDGESGNKKKNTSKDICNDLSGVSDGELHKRESLGYVTKTPVPGSFCGNCSLYIPPASESDCGGCLLFKGPVHAEGHCVQYVAKV